MQIYQDIPVPKTTRAAVGRKGPDFSAIQVGQVAVLPLGDKPEKAVERVKGQVARWRKADAARKDFKYTIALTTDPADPMGAAQVVGVWRTA